MIRTCNLIVRFSKFTLNIKIYEEFEEFFSKLVCKEALLKIIIIIIDDHKKSVDWMLWASMIKKA